jgi:hypothetical protein
VQDRNLFVPLLTGGRWDAAIMKEAAELLGTIRKNIVETLVLLSSRDEQSKYPVPDEWVCFWFDDYYHPKDYSFQQAFKESELKVLSEFNDFFEIATQQIGDPPAKPDELWAIPVWQQVMQRANITLKKLLAL